MGPPGQPRSRRSGRLGFWGIPPFLALFEAIALAVHFQNVDMVGQAIQQRSGQAFGTEDFRPFIERQIGGDNHRAAFQDKFARPAKGNEKGKVEGLIGYVRRNYRRMEPPCHTIPLSPPPSAPRPLPPMPCRMRYPRRTSRSLPALRARDPPRSTTTNCSAS